MHIKTPFACLACGLALALGVGFATAEEINPVRHQPPTSLASEEAPRFIVKLRSPNAAARAPAQPPVAAAPGDELASLARRHGISVLHSRSMAGRMHWMQVQATSGETPSETLKRLRGDPAVEFAELDQRRYPHAIPNDPLFSGQWYLQSAQPSAVDAVSAWDATTGTNGVVIALLDTGVRFDHPDLRNATGNRLLAGYDFVSGKQGANDGDGRDADASDPGDWITSADTSDPAFRSCEVENSSWHGTRVAGILGALTENSKGVAGLTWKGWILPVRVLGKCGGFDADILDGMRWAAGLHVPGIPDNPYPARIENMSLGAVGKCPASYQTVIDELVAKGVLVVTSAGNEGGPVEAPANCRGVAAVGGLRHAGTKVGYSNVGREIVLSAPAGNCVNTSAGSACLFSIDTTANSGTTTPGSSIYTDQLNRNVGTSFSAPIVAAIGGLMVSANGNLGARQLIARLREGARPFPTTSDTGTPPTCHVPVDASDIQADECVCTTQTCGAGMASAQGSVTAALRPIAAIKVTSVIAPGVNVTLDASGSAAACGRTVSDYAWTVVSPTTNPPALQQTSGPVTTLIAPIAPSEYVVRVTVTDDTGASDFADITLNSTNSASNAPANAGSRACLAAVSYTVPPPSTPPPSNPSSASGGSHGGGGSLDYMTVVALAVVGMVTRPRRRRRSESSAMT